MKYIIRHNIINLITICPYRCIYRPIDYLSNIQRLTYSKTERLTHSKTQRLESSQYFHSDKWLFTNNYFLIAPRE